MSVVDFVVRTASPDALDRTVRELPGCTAEVIAGSWDGDVCVVRVLGDAGFFRHAVEAQGYGEIVREVSR